MSKLRARAVKASVYLAVDYYSASDPGSEGYKDKILYFVGVQRILAKRRAFASFSNITGTSKYLFNSSLTFAFSHPRLFE